MERQFHLFKVAEVKVVASLRSDECHYWTKSLCQDHQRVSRKQAAFYPKWRLFLFIEVRQGEAALEVLLKEKEMRHADTDHKHAHKDVERIRPQVSLAPISCQNMTLKYVEQYGGDRQRDVADYEAY